jgi:hypothetical protein
MRFQRLSEYLSVVLRITPAVGRGSNIAKRGYLVLLEKGDEIVD